MEVLYEKSFLRDLKKVPDQKIKDQLFDIIQTIKQSNRLHLIENIKKLKGHSSAYRLRVGAYRLGFFAEEKQVVFSRFLHRKDIYKRFP